MIILFGVDIIRMCACCGSLHLIFNLRLLYCIAITISMCKIVVLDHFTHGEPVF